jgi:hypothetical protein
LRAVFLAHLSQENNHPRLVSSMFKQVLDEIGLNQTTLVVTSQDEPTDVFEIK